MPTFEVSVDEETARGLAVEADLLGFDTREAYLRWLVTRRFDIDDGGERAGLLDAYADRAAEMDLSNVQTPPIEADVDTDPPADSVGDALETNLAPSVDRIEDDRLNDSADALSNVEGARLDEFARRAVADTREQLGDGVGSASGTVPRGPSTTTAASARTSPTSTTSRSKAGTRRRSPADAARSGRRWRCCVTSKRRNGRTSSTPSTRSTPRATTARAPGGSASKRDSSRSTGSSRRGTAARYGASGRLPAA
ncbi:hypothetical protein GJ629_02245 [Halapricum sp. CBA1109]|uniref:hypothetical protein n=1 Tax=Halapricum sp. CBA1109 TaxID=2668068 RepID=UPI0012FCFAF6|nr:hypothetical protein [Halapricum sp. CBA1109]MUV88860.1 hypothetical protein [Halapricum sp. CBA1109]